MHIGLIRALFIGAGATHQPHQLKAAQRQVSFIAGPRARAWHEDHLDAMQNNRPRPWRSWRGAQSRADRRRTFEKNRVEHRLTYILNHYGNALAGDTTAPLAQRAEG